jgi:hypothetical protein
MPYKPARRRDVSLNPQIHAKAQKLAELTGLDVDSFLAMVVLALYERALEQGELRTSSEEDQEIA